MRIAPVSFQSNSYSAKKSESKTNLAFGLKAINPSDNELKMLALIEWKNGEPARKAASAKLEERRAKLAIDIENFKVRMNNGTLICVPKTDK